MQKIKIVFSDSFWIDEEDKYIQNKLDESLSKIIGNKKVINIEFICNNEGRGEFWIYIIDNEESLHGH